MNPVFIYGRMMVVYVCCNVQSDAICHNVERYTALTLGMMVWRVIMSGQRTVLVHMAGYLTAERNVNQVVLTAVWQLVQVAPGTLFQ